jgi:hypothetical protein
MHKLSVKIIISSAVLAVGLIGSAYAQSSNRSNGLSHALSNTTNTPANNVLGTVNSGTPGSGFGASVSGAANQTSVTSSSQGFTASGGIGGAGGSHHR